LTSGRQRKPAGGLSISQNTPSEADHPESARYGGTGHLNAMEDHLPIDEEAVTGGAGQQVKGGGTHPDKLSVYVKNATCRIGSRPCGIRVSMLA